MPRESIAERVELPTYLLSVAIGVTVAVVQAIRHLRDKPALVKWLGGALLVTLGGFVYAILAILPVFFLLMTLVFIHDRIRPAHERRVEEHDR